MMTNQETERMNAIHRKFLDGVEPLSQREAMELIDYLHDTVQHQANAQSDVLAAAGFEQAIRNVIDQHIKQGLTVSQASGVLSLMRAEVEMSYFLRLGSFNDVIREAVFSTKVEGP